jgi:fructose-bisphosphate aldolase class I
VLIEGTLIKPSFPQPGKLHPSHAGTTAQEIAEATANVLVRSLPIGVAGVVFLSGGLDDKTAVAYLNEVNVLKNNAISAQAHAAGQISGVIRLPPLTFSFGRGLQGDAMTHWAAGDVEGAKEAFKRRARECYQASRGELKA